MFQQLSSSVITGALCIVLMLTSCDTSAAHVPQTLPTPVPTATRVPSPLPRPAPTPTSTITPPTSTPARNAGTLAYVVHGDLWVRSLPSGVAQRLTRDADNTSPRWSPSGIWLAFCKNDEQWVIRRTGSGARHVGACGATWLSNPDRLAVDRSVITVGTWNAQTLPYSADVWSPDAASYAYVEFKPTKKLQAAHIPVQIASLWRANIDNSHATKVLASDTPASYGFVLADWIGNQLLFWQDPAFSASLLADGQPLWAVSANGGAAHQLAPAMLLYDDYRALAPNNTTLAITAGDGRESWTNKRIATVELASGALSYLTDEHTAAQTPAWSPDGAQIAYMAMRDTATQPIITDTHELAMQRRIWTMHRDGFGKRRLTNDPAYRDEAPRFTADGTQIVFARLDRYDHASVWVINVKGGAPTKLADDLGILQQPNDAPLWFEYFGHVEWRHLFDWSPR